MSSKEIITTTKAPAAIGPYSQAVRTGNLLFTSGQIPINPETGEIIEGDTGKQTEQMMKNLKAVLEAGGASLESVVKTTVFLKDMADFAVMNGVYAKYFVENQPARSAVQVARLPKDVSVEIEAIARLNM